MKYLFVLLLGIFFIGCETEYRVQTRANGYGDTIYVVQEWGQEGFNWSDAKNYSSSSNSLTSYNWSFHNKAEADSIIKLLIANDKHSNLSKYRDI